MARALDVDEAIRSAERARNKERDAVFKRGDDTDYAREFSAPAEAALLAAATVREPEPQNVKFILDEVDYVLGSEVRSSIFRDYQELAQAAIKQRWNNSTPVAPHFFAIGKDSPEPVLQLVRRLSDGLSQLVAEDPSALDAIEWRDLERMLANVFDGLGFDVELTPVSKDGGKDIVLKYWHDGRRREYIVEVKHWRSGKRVTKKYLTDFVQVVARERRDGGLFLATYGYSENAIEVITELTRDEIYIGEKPQIVSLCRSYMRRNNGLWAPTEPLYEILQSEFRRVPVA